MKVEFLAEGSAECPLIRLFDLQPGDLERLCQACADLAEGQANEFQLHAQPWVEAIRECRFTWRSSAKDLGVQLPAPGEPFVLWFSDEAWREVQDKLLMFAGGSNGFNWLTNEGDVNVLISPDGAW